MQPGRKTKNLQQWLYRHKCASIYSKFLYIFISTGYTLICFNLIYLKIRELGREYIAFNTLHTIFSTFSFTIFVKLKYYCNNNY